MKRGRSRRRHLGRLAVVPAFGMRRELEHPDHLVCGEPWAQVHDLSSTRRCIWALSCCASGACSRVLRWGRTWHVHLPATYRVYTRPVGAGITCQRSNAFSLAGHLASRVWGGEAGRSGCGPRTWVIIMPAMGRKNALLGRIRVSSALARSTHRPKRLIAYDFASSGIQPGAWMICPPTRRNYRTAALGSCAERRFQDRRPLISEACAPKHIPSSPSSSAYIHYEPQKLIPAHRSCGPRARVGVRPSGSDTICARFAPRHQRCLRCRNRPTDVILGLVPRTHRGAHSLSPQRHAMRSNSH